MSQRPLSPADLHLLKKEIEAQGEFLNQERLDRTSDIDRLRIELASLKATLEKLVPEFSRTYEEVFSEKLQSFNPEAKAG